MLENSSKALFEFLVVLLLRLSSKRSGHDVSQSFSLFSPLWINRTSDRAKMQTGTDDNILWVYGGWNGSFNFNIDKYKHVIEYDTNSKSWSIPSTQGTPLT